MLAQLIQLLQNKFAVSPETIALAVRDSEDALDLLFVLHQQKTLSFEEFDRACEWLVLQTSMGQWPAPQPEKTRTSQPAKV